MATKKVRLFDKRIVEVFFKYASIFATVVSIIFIFIKIPDGWEINALLLLIIVLIFKYFIIWFYANKQTEIVINIDGTTVEIKTGDIFKQDELKVIPFNEYFDTIVDNIIINERSLHGQYINNYSNLDVLNQLVENDSDLNETENILEEGIKRSGKNTKYRLGSILLNEEFVLTAFSKFDEKNRAYLTIVDYLDFLMNFWDEINRVYAQKKISVPIFGSGITRFKKGFGEIDDNELLEIMIWTFKLSKIKFEYPAKLTILIHEDKIDKINIFKLKGLEK